MVGTPFTTSGQEAERAPEPAQGDDEIKAESIE